MPALSTHELREAVARIPHFPLGHFPTPLEHLQRFSEKLGGPNVYIKRDDCTGLAMGGNKTRHNELILADAINQGADIIVWGAGLQSNNCRQTAAACAKAGIDIHLILGRGGPAAGPDPIQGNLLLDHLLGAKVEIVDGSVGPEVDARIEEVAAQYTAAGRKVYRWDRKTVKPLAAISYVTTLIEIIEQSATMGFVPDAIYGCSAGSTGAGLCVGRAALGHSYPICHVAPIVWPWDTQSDMARIATEAAQRLDLDVSVVPDDVDVTFDYIGPGGYGKVYPGCLEAISLVARNEGILLDPSYSGKAMAGLIDHVRSGRLTAGQNVVFVHTGGTPALFAYTDELMEGIGPVSE